MAINSDTPSRCDVATRPSRDVGKEYDDDGGKQKRERAEAQKAQSKSSLIKLCTFFPSLTPHEQISRTATYAQNPRKYLQDVLGTDTMERRKHLLCIPDEVTRDIYGEGSHKSHFEQHIATLLGKKHGLFFLTGVQTQLVAIKIHCEAAKNNRVGWHVTSHLETAEQRSYQHLYGLERKLVGVSPTENPTVAEIRKALSLPPHERPAVLVLEIPNRVLGCTTYTFEELEQISLACRAAQVKLHMDGARLWEIEPWYQATAGKTFADICPLFDTVYTSMYKALSGAAGAVLVTDDEHLIMQAKVWQRRAGGTAVTVFYQTIDCERGYNENIGTFTHRRLKMIEVAARIQEATSRFRNKDGGPIVRFMPSTPTCCQTRTVFTGYTVDELLAARDRVQEKLNVRVFERTWPKMSLDELMASLAEKKDEGRGDEKTDGANEDEKEVAKALIPDDADLGPHEIEWFINANNEQIETDVFVRVYVALCEELLSPP